MKKSGIALGLVVAVCAFGVSAAPAMAFGKFFASIKGKTISEAEPGRAKGLGELEHLKLGPYRLECKRVVDEGQVVSEGPSESFFTEIKMADCETVVIPKETDSGLEEVKKTHIRLAMEFLSNGAAKTGEGESEIRIKQPSEVAFKTTKSSCTIVVPSQNLPLKQSPTKEFEFAVPETEEEILEKPKSIEKYGEVRKRLAFALDIKKIRSYFVPNAKCRYKEGSEGGKFNPETGRVEYPGGIMEGSLKEITLKGGNLWFEE
jgi:hypothetical protein